MRDEVTVPAQSRVSCLLLLSKSIFPSRSLAAWAEHFFFPVYNITPQPEDSLSIQAWTSDDFASFRPEPVQRHHTVSPPHHCDWITSVSSNNSRGLFFRSCLTCLITLWRYTDVGATAFSARFKRVEQLQIEEGNKSVVLFSRVCAIVIQCSIF